MSEAPNLLCRLYAEAAAEVARRRQTVGEDGLRRRAALAAAPLDFARALRGERLRVIAEMKRTTPSRGLLASDYAPGRLAAAYAAGGAAAISVLCQKASFGGSPDHLARARRAAPETPILRKDFIFDEYQVLEARAFGADAVLLILAGLEVERARELLDFTRRLGMEALVEIHDEEEAKAALEIGASVVGVNHRDLDTFEIDVSLSERLRPRVPAAVVFVAESGILTPEDALRMRRAGADAVLVGEALMRAAAPSAAISRFEC